MRKIGRYAGLLLCGVALSVPGAARAADPTGTWLTEKNEATIRIARCGDALCGQITALREPRDPASGRPKTDEHNRDPKLRHRPLIGVTIIVGMKPVGTRGEWAGHVYNPDDGHFYPAKLMLRGASVLRLEGCMIKRVLCDGQTWVRAH